MVDAGIPDLHQHTSVGYAKKVCDAAR
jgi:hypothetical protein